MLYEDAKEMVEYVALALKQTSIEATILLYSPALDPHLQKMTELADRVFCFYEMPKVKSRAKIRAPLGSNNMYLHPSGPSRRKQQQEIAIMPR